MTELIQFTLTVEVEIETEETDALDAGTLSDTQMTQLDNTLASMEEVLGKANLTLDDSNWEVI